MVQIWLLGYNSLPVCGVPPCGLHVVNHAGFFMYFVNYTLQNKYSNGKPYFTE